jgi:hypothetical protein
MTPLDKYIQEAIDHEAGHIVVANQQGIAVFELFVMLTRVERGYEIRDFATESEDPSEAEIKEMPEELKEDFALFISGGVAGNKFGGLNVITPGADTDRQELKRFTDTSLEDMCEEALKIIQSERRRFRRIRSLAQQSLSDLLKNSNLQTGRHILLNEEDLQEAFEKK